MAPPPPPLTWGPSPDGWMSSWLWGSGPASWRQWPPRGPTGRRPTRGDSPSGSLAYTGHGVTWDISSFMTFHVKWTWSDKGQGMFFLVKWTFSDRGCFVTGNVSWQRMFLSRGRLWQGMLYLGDVCDRGVLSSERLVTEDISRQGIVLCSCTFCDRVCFV